MSNPRAITTLFVLSLSLIIISVTWLIFYILYYAVFLLEELTFILILIIGCLGFLMAFMSFYETQIDVKFEINEVEDKEKNVRDMYQYDQFLDPPTINN